MSATANQFSAWMRSLHEHIEEDFGLAARQPAERAELLERLSGMVMTDAITRAVDLLSDEDGTYLENMLDGDGANNPEKQQYAAAFIISKVPNFGRIMEEAYEEVRTVCLEVVEKDREKKFEEADQTNEAVGDLAEAVEGGIEDAGVEVPGLSALSLGIDLLYDPARFRRSPGERQERFFKHVAVLTGKALSLGWLGLAFFTGLNALEHFHVIRSLPKAFTELVPNWYERRTIGGQMSLLGILAVAGTILLVLTIFLLGRLAKSPRLARAFEMKVSDDDLASKVIRSILTSTYPSIVTERNMREFSKIVYRSVLLESSKANSDNIKMLGAILDDGNERAAVAFLKSKTRGYKGVMQEKAEEFCKNTAQIMGGIS